MDTAKVAAKTAAKPKALSLHLGLNTVSPAAYAGWDGLLAACEFDANDMAAIARSRGMKPTVLLGKKATRKAVLAAMRSAAKALKRHTRRQPAAASARPALQAHATGRVPACLRRAPGLL